MSERKEVFTGYSGLSMGYGLSGWSGDDMDIFVHVFWLLEELHEPGRQSEGL